MQIEIERGKLHAAGAANESYQENYQIKEQYKKYMKQKDQFQIENEALQENREIQMQSTQRIKKGTYIIDCEQRTKQTKNLNDGRIAKGTLRPYILITLGHAEKREIITTQQIEQILRKLFQCSSIVITKEKHQNEGWHIHIAVKNFSASKNNATKIIREAFSQFEGRQCNVTFHKGFAYLIGYVTKNDKEPHVWGEFSKEEILNIGEKARSKKKANTKPVTEILQKINECQQWLDVYSHTEIIERILYGTHSNVKKIFQDLKILKESKESALQRIQRYLDQREVEKRGIQEYEPEEIKEKYPLIDWIACNLIYKRPLKTKQLLLYGPPSTQKTLIFDKLRKAIRIYFVGVRMNDFAGADDYYDLWVFDEFHNHERESGMGETIYSENANVFNNTMLRILDGQECRLDAKYGEVLNKTRNVPIVLIANQIPSKMRSYGPMQERVMRLRFNSRIANIDEERLILTLKGCIERRIKKDQKQGKEEEIKYNQETAIVFEKKEQNVKQGTNKNIKRQFKAKTEEKREIRIVYESQNAEDDAKKKTTVKIVIDEEQLTKGAMSTLKYAGIPIKKRRKEEKEGEEETRIVAFRAELPEANFKIIRNQREQTDDYLTWPILLHLNHRREICNAEMVIENKQQEGQKKEQEKKKGTEKEIVTIRVGPAPKNKRRRDPYFMEQQDYEEKLWEEQQWDEHD